MGQINIRVPDELEERIKRDIGRRAAETGNLQNKSDWWRDAAREKLGDVTIKNENSDEQTVQNGGTS